MESLENSIPSLGHFIKRDGIDNGNYLGFIWDWDDPVIGVPFRPVSKIVFGNYSRLVSFYLRNSCKEREIHSSSYIRLVHSCPVLNGNASRVLKSGLGPMIHRKQVISTTVVSSGEGEQLP